jgi:Spy/CpxP family protein refolding chaperone
MLVPDYLIAQIVPTPASQSGSVTGVIRTATGVPASGIRVTAMRVDSTDDRLRAMASLSQTDATGRYRLDNVPPGRYYITAGRVDLPTYYPGTLDMTKGTVISISSSSPSSDIDFVIQDTSAAVPTVAGVPGLRSGGPGGILPVLGVLNGINSPLGNTFQGQGGPAPRSAGPGRNSGAAAANPPAPGLTGRGTANGSQTGLAWWTNAALVMRLGLTDDQKKKIESTVDQYRQTLVQNMADLQSAESVLDRMLRAEPMEPAKTVSTQIERVIQARGEVERTNSKMTLDIRQILTRAQWVQLQAEVPQTAIAPATNLGAAGPTNPAGGRSGGPRTGGPPPAPVPPPATTGAK